MAMKEKYISVIKGRCIGKPLYMTPAEAATRNEELARSLCERRWVLEAEHREAPPAERKFSYSIRRGGS
jgi:hypothetical protein